MFKKSLLSSVAIAALIAGAPGAFAQSPISQTPTNSGVKNNNGTINVTVPGTLGLGTSLAVSATGAVASTSVTGFNNPFMDALDGYSTIYQNATNNGGAFTNNTGVINMTGGAYATNAGSSVSISSTGALSAVSTTGIGAGNDDDFAAPTTTGATTQYATNAEDVNNTGSANLFGQLTLKGNGSSVSITAGGAFTSVSETGINALSFGMGNHGTIYQSSVNTGGAPVTNSVAALIYTGDLDGQGSSVSTGASGATAAVGATFIDVGSVAGSQFGAITQSSSNTSDVTNRYINSDRRIWTGELDAHGTSVSSSASGAVSSVGFTNISIDENTARIRLNDVSQTAVNGNGGTANVRNGDGLTQLHTGNLDGIGASVSSTASGAVAAVGFTNINSTYRGVNSTNAGGDFSQNARNENNSSVTNSTQFIDTGALTKEGTSVGASASGATASLSSVSLVSTDVVGLSLGSVGQTAVNNGNISNATPTITTGNLSGLGSSVSANATGAVTSVSLASINSENDVGVTVGAISQNSNSTGSVGNSTTTIQTGALSGDGAAVSSSATAALSSVSSGSVDGNNVSGLHLGTVSQTATNNSGNVTNTATSVSTGVLSGDGSSVSTGASGAVASTAISNIESESGASSVGRVSQSATNNSTGNVTNAASTVTIGGLQGAGSSASISANGALAALSLSSIKSDPGLTTINSSAGNSITQTAINYSTVTNSNGTINAGSLTGIGTSAVISSTGAAASLSVASIADTTLGSVDINGGITQSASNYASVNNTGTITAGALSGTGPSLSISAVGAGAFASFNSVK